MSGMLLTDVPWWQLATSAADGRDAYLLTLGAARLYAGGLRRTGRRVGRRQTGAGAEDC